MKIGILGASGYSGAEALKILLKNSKIKLIRVFANTYIGEKVSTLYPQFRNNCDLTYEAYSIDACDGLDILLLALPSGEALKLIPDILAKGKKVIDFGGDFRLRDVNQYAIYYGRTHTALSDLKKSVYGLTELNRINIQQARLLSNPGCYATSIILPLVPLLKEKIIDMNIIVNSMSGVSGAGRSASLNSSFVEVNESVKAYRVGNHQHLPEIEQALFDYADAKPTINFTPFLIPISRGIYTSIQMKLTKDVSEDDVYNIYKKYYREETFIRFDKNFIPEIKGVTHTNYTDIGFVVHPQTKSLSVFSAIDNLLKGAAGQAIQNLNLMINNKESDGLL